MTLNPCDEATLAAYLREQRSTTEDDVRRAAAAHDADDLRPEERATYDTGSMRRLETS